MKFKKTALVVVLLATLALLLARTPRAPQSEPLVESAAMLSGGGSTAASRSTPTLSPTVDETIARLRGISEPAERSETIEQLTQDLNLSQVRTWLNALVNSTNAADSELREVLLRQWAQIDVQAAASWAQELDGNGRAAAITQVSIAWAEQNVAESIAWARNLTADNDRDTALLQIGFEAARTDPIETVRVALDLPNGSQRDELMNHAAAQWATFDSAAAHAWASQLDDIAMRQRLIGTIISSSAEHDGLGTATRAVSELPAGPIQDRTVVSVIQRWSQVEPAQAAAWVKEFPASPLGLDAMENLVTSWSRFDSVSAHTWLLSLPPSQLRDAGLRQWQVSSGSDGVDAR